MTVRRLKVRSAMPATAEQVFAWHARAGALERLAPPWERVRIVGRSADGVTEGTRVVLQAKLGPVPVRWIARHGPVVEGREFVDEQVSGPFSRWRHTHRFVPAEEGTSIYEDDVEYELPFGVFGGLGDGIVRSRLARMFAYRHEVVRGDLERHLGFGGRRLRVAISGASGLLGSTLHAFLSTGGHDVRRIVRASPGPRDVVWDPSAGRLDAAGLENLDAIVHLAGENIAAGRWTAERKRRILRSRVDGTRLLAEAVGRLAVPPRVFASASAVGFYGRAGSEPLDESAPAGTGFLADVCRAWEEATEPALLRGLRTVVLRFGVVLTARGGALAKMLPAFLVGAGGPIGGGGQGMSWVAIDDVVGAILFTLMTESLVGPVNVTAPRPVTQREFAATLGRVLRRPAILPLPAPVVRTIFGEMGEEMLLAGQSILPGRITAAGFRFRHPDLESALRFELGRASGPGPEIVAG